MLENEIIHTNETKLKLLQLSKQKGCNKGFKGHIQTGGYSGYL